MKVSLFDDLRKYSKTKGILPLDERQMDTLKDMYLELAKSVILGFMVLMISYGYMEMAEEKVSIPYLSIAMCVLGAITYYYTLRVCYRSVVGFDSNFEVLLIPAFAFTPFIFFHSIWIILDLCNITKHFYVYLIVFLSLPILFLLVYAGANKAYQNGRKNIEKEINEGELHFTSRKLMVNNIIVFAIVLNFLPISYEFYFKFGIVAGAILLLYNIYIYGFQNPNNEYILNEDGIVYHKALWGKKGGIIKYDDIKDILQQDTFNIGYSKDKICIICKDGKKIRLYPENAYRFCVEVKNNI